METRSNLERQKPGNLGGCGSEVRDNSQLIEAFDVHSPGADRIMLMENASVVLKSYWQCAIEQGIKTLNAFFFQTLLGRTRGYMNSLDSVLVRTATNLTRSPSRSLKRRSCSCFQQIAEHLMAQAWQNLRDLLIVLSFITR